MGKYRITTVPENCSGCSRCQLSCSEANSRTFNPASANIYIDMQGLDCRITFSNECNACGICADNCFYGALIKTVRKDTP